MGVEGWWPGVLAFRVSFRVLKGFVWASLRFFGSLRFFRVS